MAVFALNNGNEAHPADSWAFFKSIRGGTGESMIDPMLNPKGHREFDMKFRQTKMLIDAMVKTGAVSNSNRLRANESLAATIDQYNDMVRVDAKRTAILTRGVMLVGVALVWAGSATENVQLKSGGSVVFTLVFLLSRINPGREIIPKEPFGLTQK